MGKDLTTYPIKLNRDELVRVLICLDKCLAYEPQSFPIKQLQDKIKAQIDALVKKQKELGDDNMEKDLFFVEEVRTKNVLIMGSFDWCMKWICENCKIEHGNFIDDDNEVIDLHAVTEYEIN